MFSADRWYRARKCTCTTSVLREQFLKVFMYVWTGLLRQQRIIPVILQKFLAYSLSIYLYCFCCLIFMSKLGVHQLFLGSAPMLNRFSSAIQQCQHYWNQYKWIHTFAVKFEVNCAGAHTHTEAVPMRHAHLLSGIPVYIHNFTLGTPVWVYNTHMHLQCKILNMTGLLN